MVLRALSILPLNVHFIDIEKQNFTIRGLASNVELVIKICTNSGGIWPSHSGNSQPNIVDATRSPPGHSATVCTQQWSPAGPMLNESLQIDTAYWAYCIPDYPTHFRRNPIDISITLRNIDYSLTPKKAADPDLDNSRDLGTSQENLEDTAI